MDARHIYKVLDEIREDVKQLHTDHHTLRNELTRYKGFVGGAAFIIGAAWAVFGLVFAYVRHGGGS